MVRKIKPGMRDTVSCDLKGDVAMNTGVTVETAVEFTVPKDVEFTVPGNGVIIVPEDVHHAG